MRDTIYALATAPGRAAIAVIRVSGGDAGAMLKRFCGPLPKAREAALRIVKSASGEPIDQALVLWFPAPGSFTGEDVFELQLHGGPAIIAAATEALAALGARPADPGEFTRRAFEEGRLELSQAEAVADLVDAETEAQRRQALSQLGGALKQRGEQWRTILIDALAFLSASIDFSDEDVPADVAALALHPLKRLHRELEEALKDLRGERVRDGLKIALVGPPNAGKSSLFNALVGRDAAIVTPFAGTTRDVIEAAIVINGYKVVLADMAGLRDAQDEVEKEGVRRAKAWAAAADLRLHLVEPGHTPKAVFDGTPNDVIVRTKSDLTPGVDGCDAETICVSTVTKEGLSSIRSFLARWVVSALKGAEFSAITRARHRNVLQAAERCVSRALARSIDDVELLAEDVRLAARALESLSGRVDQEAVLDKVFGSFCIGK